MQEARLHAGVSLGSRDVCTGILCLWRGPGFDSVPEWSCALLCPQGIGTWGYSPFRPDKAFSLTGVQVSSSVGAGRKVLSWVVLFLCRRLKAVSPLICISAGLAHLASSLRGREMRGHLLPSVWQVFLACIFWVNLFELSCLGTAFELGKAREQLFACRIYPCFPS